MTNHTPQKRTCAGTTKAGNPCHSTLVRDDGYCTVHSPSPPFDLVELGRQGGIASGVTRRERAKSFRARLAEKLEGELELVWSAFRDGMGSEDERTRIAAAVAAVEQAFGRAPVAVVGDEDEPVTFVVRSAFALAEEDAA